MPRAIDQRYLDPVDEVWLAAARKLGATLISSSL